MFDTILTCKEAASEIRAVIGAACLCPHVADMLRYLDECQGAAACPGHRRLDIIEGASERAEADHVETAILALLN